MQKYEKSLSTAIIVMKFISFCFLFGNFAAESHRWKGRTRSLMSLKSSSHSL